VATELERFEAPFPNKLREFRETAGLTREGLKGLCDNLGQNDPLRYKSISLTTLRNLELGQNRPKIRTANTISKAIEQSVSVLFPLGLDDPLKNPLGNTSITEGRITGGRKRKITNK
jgi:transcriptional regulator with XRE-family HTH domain